MNHCQEMRGARRWRRRPTPACLPSFSPSILPSFSRSANPDSEISLAKRRALTPILPPSLLVCPLPGLKSGSVRTTLLQMRVRSSGFCRGLRFLSRIFLSENFSIVHFQSPQAHATSHVGSSCHETVSTPTCERRRK